MHEELTAQSRRPALLQWFWWIAGALVFAGAWNRIDSPDSFAVPALLIAACALVPSYLWCAGQAPGLPIFPLYTAVFLLTHVFPLLSPPPLLIASNTEESVWKAALTVAGFLLLATASWWFSLNRPRARPTTCLILGGERGHSLYLVILMASVALSVATNADWLSQFSEGMFATLRGFVRGLTGLAVLMLATSWGERTLSPASTKAFLVLFVGFCIADAASLFLVSAVVACTMLAVGFVLGRGRLPVLVLVAVVVLGLLHMGKGPMRQRYWTPGAQGHVIEPWRYPSLYADWLEASLDQLAATKSGENQSATIFGRVNNLTLLLQVQRMSPLDVPLLHGETYAIIPSSLLPRLFFPDKTSPHLSTSMLNVHFGNQTWEAAESTTIGWGLLNESFANFGLAGCAGLAVVLGLFYGLVTRLGIGFPTASIHALVGIFTMGFAVQTEWTASVFISTYLQGLMAVLAVALVSAKRMSIRDATGETDLVLPGCSAAGVPAPAAHIN